MALKSSGSITLMNLSELVTYELSSSVSAIMKDVNNEGALSASSIVFTPKKYIGDALQENFQGYIYIQYISEDETVIENGYGSSLETTKLQNDTHFTEVHAILYEDSTARVQLARKQVFIIETGKNGEPGAGYSVFLSSDSHIFPGDTDGALLGYGLSVKLEAYKNSDPLAMYNIVPTINGITIMQNSDTDLILSEDIDISEDNSSAILTFKVNKPFNEGGTVLISFTDAGRTMVFQKSFTYGVALRGEKGEDGEDAQSKESILSVAPYYIISNSNEIPPQEKPATGSNWVLERPNKPQEGEPQIEENQFLWGSYLIEFVDDQPLFSSPFYIPWEEDILKVSTRPIVIERIPIQEETQPENGEGTQSEGNDSQYEEIFQNGAIWFDTQISPYELKIYSDGLDGIARGWSLISYYRNDIDMILEKIEHTEQAIEIYDQNIRLQNLQINEIQTSLTNFTQEFSSQLVQSSKDISMQFTNIQNSIQAADVSKTKYYKDLQTYIDFNLEGITIGKKDNEMTMLLSNEKLSFFNNNAEIAYFNGLDNRLYISDGSFINSINIGNYTWVLETDGSLSLTYDPEKTNIIVE